MDTAIALLGAVGSLFGAYFAWKQADKAKTWLIKVEEIKDEIIGRAKISDLSKLNTQCEMSIRAFEKFGPGASASSFIGTSIENDSEGLHSLLGQVTINRSLLEDQSIADNFVQNVSTALENLSRYSNIDLATSVAFKAEGNKVWSELCLLSQALKSQIDSRKYK